MPRRQMRAMFGSGDAPACAASGAEPSIETKKAMETLRSVLMVCWPKNEECGTCGGVMNVEYDGWRAGRNWRHFRCRRSRGSSTVGGRFPSGHASGESSFQFNELYVREAIDAGLADVAAGRTIPHDEVKARLREVLRRA